MTEFLELLLSFVIFGPAVPMLVALRNRLQARRQESFAASSRRLGLNVEELGGGTFRATGHVAGRAVTVDESYKGVVELEVRTGERFTIKRAGALVEPVVVAVASGDDAFDAVVAVEGAGQRAEAAEWVSSLTAEARAALVAVVRAGAVHEFGRWTLQTSPWQSDPRSPLDRLVEAAAGMAAPGDVVARLRERATTDPVPEVRLLAADRLVARLERQKVTDPGLLAALEQELPSELARVRIARLRGHDGEATVRAALGSPSAPVALEAALGLAQLARGPAVEAALLAVLPRGDARVVEALARWGTAAAVAPLRAWEERHPRRDDLVADAIRAIQNRAVGAAAGQISLAAAGGADGALAEPVDAGGLAAAPERPRARERQRE